MKRAVLILLFSLLFLKPLSAKDYGFGFKRSQNGERPEIGREMEELLNKYNSHYIGEDKKQLYLTFDCGYENGYTKDMIDILNKYNIKACFFITGHFIRENKDLVLEMSRNENFVIGNHTNKHKNMAKITDNEILKDLKENEKIYSSLIDKPFSNYIRPPEGSFNERSLKITNEHNYKNIFWSISYVDWKIDEQKGKDYAFKQLTNQLHNGAIILLHNVSLDNKLVLEDFIIYCLKENYEFKSLQNL